MITLWRRMIFLEISAMLEDVLLRCVVVQRCAVADGDMCGGD